MLYDLLRWKGVFKDEVEKGAGKALWAGPCPDKEHSMAAVHDLHSQGWGAGGVFFYAWLYMATVCELKPGLILSEESLYI